MMKCLILLACIGLMLFFNACSARGYASPSGGAGYTEWKLNF